MRVLVFTCLCGFVRGDWVEIPQFTSGKRYINRHGTGVPSTTTPSGYDVFMKTPAMQFENNVTISSIEPAMSTTPEYVTSTQIDYDSTTNDKLMIESIDDTDEVEDEADHGQFQRRDEDEADHGQFHRRNEEPTENEQEKSENEELKYNGFLPLLKNIQETLLRNAKKSVRSKVALLQNLRDNLLGTIDEKMQRLWHRSSDQSSEARGQYEHEHEMDFPSNEGALMTIGLLTFAVFLIKLVLKLIHALKAKYNNTMATTIAPGTMLIGRKRREVQQDYDSARILQLIDEYNFR